jgi:hypothetical protein
VCTRFIIWPLHPRQRVFQFLYVSANKGSHALRRAKCYNFSYIFIALMSFSSISSSFSSSLALRCTLACVRCYNLPAFSPPPPRDRGRRTLMTFLMSLARAAKRSVPIVSSTLNAAGLARGIKQ